MHAPQALALDMRPVTLDDVSMVADLDATRDPEDPRDPQMMRFWWTSGSLNQDFLRLVAVHEGHAVAFVAALHERWSDGTERFGSLRVVMHSDIWSEREFARLIEKGEEWLGSEGVVKVVTRVREDFDRELRALQRIGYREVRRQNFSELDLVIHRDGLLQGLSQERQKMKAQGVTMLTLSEYHDPDRLAKLHEMMVAAEQDIPSTVPIPRQPFDEWMRATFDDPGVREDRFWIAPDGEGASAGMVGTVGARMVGVAEGGLVLEGNMTGESHGFPTSRGTIIHGGAVATLADEALASVAFTAAEEGETTVTADLKVDFLRPARPGRLLARATVRHRTRRLAFCEATVEQDGGPIVAEARAVIAYVKA